MTDSTEQFLEHLRRCVEAGEHEHILSALGIVYQMKRPVPFWLARAIEQWMYNTETPEQAKARKGRVRDDIRFALFENAVAQGYKGDDALGTAGAAAEDFGGEVEGETIRKAVKRVRRRHRRAGLEIKRVKSGKSRK